MSDTPAIAITGIGLTTSLGRGVSTNWRRLVAGESGIAPLESLDVGDYPVRDGGEVEAAPDLPPLADGTPAPPSLRHLLATCREAVGAATVSEREVESGRCGLAIGSSLAASTVSENFFTSRRDRGVAGAEYELLRGYHMDRHFEYLAGALDLRGPTTIVSNACAAGAGALARGFDWLASGRCDAVIAAGYDAFSVFTFAGFGSLFALSESRTRPFAGDRDGMKIGGGYAAVLLEPLARARQHGREPLAILSGYGESSDAHHLTQPHPKGRGAALAMQRALEMAALDPGAIDVINCHATATPSNDAAEARAMQEVFGDRLASIPVYAPKPAVGHTLGGAGTVEAVVSVLFLREQELAPTLNVEKGDVDPEIGVAIDFTRSGSRRVRHVMSNSFGFGGSNATLIFSLPAGDGEAAT